MVGEIHVKSEEIAAGTSRVMGDAKRQEKNGASPADGGYGYSCWRGPYPEVPVPIRR